MRDRRPALTLIELLLSLGIIGTLSSIIMAAVSPNAQFSAAHDAQRRVMERGLVNAVRQYTVDRGIYPGDKSITSTPLSICRQTVTSPTCINLDNLVTDGYLTALPVDISESDPLLTGYTISIASAQLTVTSTYIGTGITPAAQCAIAFTPPAFFVDGNGANGINKSPTQNSNTSRFISFNNKLYATWSEVNQIRAAVYNGNDSSPSWTFIDGNNAATGLNKDTGQGAFRPRFVVFSNKLYLMWDEQVSGFTNNQVRAVVYNGNDSSPSWTFVDGNGANGLNKSTTNIAQRVAPAVFNNKLYVMWNEQNASAVYQIRIRVYNGNDSSPSWTFVDGNGANGINKSTTRTAIAPQLEVLNGKLYAIWMELNGSSVYQTRVAVYNGNDGAPAWTFVDGNGANGINKSTARNAQYPQFAVLNNKLYAMWFESNGSVEQMRAVVYNGNDGAPTWTFVDGNGANGINKNVAYSANHVQMAVADGELYAVWPEYNATNVRQIRLSKYNGNDASPSWTFVDGNGANGINKDVIRTGQLPALAVNASKLYLTWYEDNASGNLEIRAARESACP